MLRSTGENGRYWAGTSDLLLVRDHTQRTPGAPGNRAAGPLTCMHQIYILVHMRTTLNIDDKLLEKAARLTGTSEKTALVRRGLEALIALESARRLAALGGTEKKLRPIPRRRQPAA